MQVIDWLQVEFSRNAGRKFGNLRKTERCFLHIFYVHIIVSFSEIRISQSNAPLIFVMFTALIKKWIYEANQRTKIYLIDVINYTH